mmetsp:Transcript_16253/g.32542  ORF Transcript_16253/g.32542 Transcript_16253/m.32542 type:complete len:118 (-) Transcript_16253:1122-1475(-)
MGSSSPAGAPAASAAGSSAGLKSVPIASEMIFNRFIKSSEGALSGASSTTAGARVKKEMEDYLEGSGAGAGAGAGAEYCWGGAAGFAGAALGASTAGFADSAGALETNLLTTGAIMN